MLDEHVPLLEGARIEQQLYALARAQPAAGMLRLGPPGAAAEASRRPHVFELANDVLQDRPPDVLAACAQAAALDLPSSSSTSAAAEGILVPGP